MKIFVSWSGEQSHAVALALREWLPTVIQRLQPWVSSEDIDKGAGWLAEIDQELLSTERGIVCVTPGNEEAAWLNYEAGALAKRTGQKRVCVALLGVSNTDLRGPLKNFQTTDLADKAEVWKLIKTLNEDVEQSERLRDGLLRHTFDREWDALESALSEIRERTPGADEVPKRETREILEEILALVREQSRTTSGTVWEAALAASVLANQTENVWPATNWRENNRSLTARLFKYASEAGHPRPVRVADLEYGPGTLLIASDSSVEVRFDDGITRTLDFPRWELKIGVPGETFIKNPTADEGGDPAGV